jgi:sugar phosphate isomerase/epimerase
MSSFPFAKSDQAPSPSRRRFIGSMFAAAFAAPTCRAAAEAPAGGATLGFNTYGMKTLSTEDALHELAKIGYDSIELDCTADCDADPTNLTAARRGDIRKIAADLGLKLTAVQGVPSPTFNDQQHAAGLERFKVMAQLVHDLNPEQPPLIEVGLGGRDPWEKMKPLFVRRVADWVKLAESSDFRFVVKPHRDTSMDRPEEAVELFKELGTPNCLRMSYDFSHFALRDMRMADTIRTALPWTGFVAIKDVAMENGRGVFKLPGETRQIDYPALIRQFHEGGYRGDYNCEISSMIFRKPGFDCLAAARTSYANIAPAFAAAGVARVKRS